MHVSPATQSAAKPSRSKGKDVPVEGASGKKTIRVRKKTVPPVQPDGLVEVIALHPTPEEMAGMIATAAYFIAAERQFAVGHELDDWLEAERRLRAQFSA